MTLLSSTSWGGRGTSGRAAPSDTEVIATPGVSGLVRELAGFLMPMRRLDVATLAADLPRGDGHAVLVLPAVLRGDGLTYDVRRLLKRLEYVPHGWDLGVNLGPTAPLVAGSLARLEALAAVHGKVSIVGYSMGGLFARWLALERPHLVRRIVTVGSPFRAPLSSTIMPPRLLFLMWGGADRVTALAAGLGRQIAVPSTCIFTREDGVVAWETCLEHDGTADSLAFQGKHLTMVRNEAVLRAICDRLARSAA